VAEIRWGDGVTEIRESRDIDLDGKQIGHAAAYLRGMSDGLTEVTITIEADVSYGSPYLISKIQGWRPATEQEIRHHQQEIESRELAQRRRDELDVDRLRKRRPDLFV
jgi:hypothetical protein